MAYDLAVVGGGILARAIVHRLASTGSRAAWVRPAGSPVGQASAAAGAMLAVYSEVSPHERPDRRLIDLRTRREARRGYERWLRSIEAAGAPPIPIREGLYVVGNAAGEDDEAALDAISAAAAGCEEPAEELRASEVPGYSPHPAARGFRALYLRNEGSVEARTLLDALEISIRGQGVDIVAGTAIRVVPHPSGVRVLLDDGRECAADGVVLAVGAATTHLLQRSAINETGLPPVFSGRGVSLLMRAAQLPERTIRTPNRTFACGLHVVPQDDGQLYLGATNRFSMLPDGERLPSAAEIAQLLSGGTRELDTRLADAEVVSIQVGHRPVTADRMPCVGRTAVESILVATGTYRNGILLAPLCAELIQAELEHPGSTADHAFAPVRATPAPPDGEMEAWLRRASRSLVTTIVEPGGSLPHHRSDDLQRFFYVVLRSALDPDADRDGLLQKLERTFRRAPIEEGVPLLFDVISRHGA
jgi:glycine/D-amino acid oxidase-like deaminating enzyme